MTNPMPNGQHERAVSPAARRSAGGVPGLRAALVIAGLAGIGAGGWAMAGAGSAPHTQADGPSRVAEVQPQELDDALGTIDATPGQLAPLRARTACNARLAWVTIMRVPGQPAGRIRLQSGPYVSPAFSLTDTPQRVALPYPAPYATGRGTIAVLGATTDAIVALNPPWHVAAQGGPAAQEVTWNPVGACPPGQR